MPSTFIDEKLGLFSSFLFRNRWFLVIGIAFLNGMFGLGLLSLSLNNNIEDIYVSKRTPTTKLMNFLDEYFPDQSDNNFTPYASVYSPLFIEVILGAKVNGNVFDDHAIVEIKHILGKIRNLTVSSDYHHKIAYHDVCARNNKTCVSSGLEILQLFKHCNISRCLDLKEIENNYDEYDKKEILSNIGRYTLEGNHITQAHFLRFRFYLQQSSPRKLDDSKKWIQVFVSNLNMMSSDSSQTLSLYFRHSSSLLEELGEETYPDVRYDNILIYDKYLF